MATSTQPKISDTLFDWLNYLGNLHVSAIDMGLSRVLPVAQHLGVTDINNQTKQKPIVFTVAGTNGKGSTTASISAITEKAGYKTALYQSPHITHFNERIQINNKPIDDTTLIHAFKKVDDARIELNQSLSFFEATTLAALLIFQEADCDVWVLEIGLGGRLDVVNIINPNVAVITNIGIDHIAWLGNDKEKIGYEKAGVLRKNIPCILASSNMPASVWKKTKELNNLVFVHNIDYQFSENSQSLNKDSNVQNSQQWLYSTQAVTMVLPMPSLALENVSAAITAVLASPLTISQNHISKALTQLNLMGRFYQTNVVFNKKQVSSIFDALHNPDGAQFLLNKLIPRLKSYKKTHTINIVFSMLADKDIKAVISLLNKTIKATKWKIMWHIAPLDVARAASLDLLLTEFETTDIDKSTIKTYKNVQNATLGAYQLALESDKILVCGSFHTIADALTVVDV